MKNKILFITSTFPRSQKDEQVPWMGELVRKLKFQGVNLDVFAPAFKGLVDHQYFGMNVYRFRYAPAPLEILTHEEGAIFKLRQKPWLIFLPFFYLIFGAIAIIKLTRNHYYNIIHVNWPFPQGFFGLVAKWTTSAKLILTFYGAEFTLVNRIPLGKFLLRLIIKQADKVIAISSFTKKRILEIADVPVEIIPFASGISQKKFQTPKIKTSLSKNKKILFVGRLIERKGVSYLIGAMPQILKTTNVRLDIIGGGPLFPQLKKQIQKMNLQKNVFLQGIIPEKKLVSFYQNCDLFVLPAIVDKWGDTEGLGVVLLEAMSFKKPVIASNVGGIIDIVKPNQSGILVPQKNSPALAVAITKVLKNRNLSKKLGQLGYQYLQEKFSWETIINKTLKIYG